MFRTQLESVRWIERPVPPCNGKLLQPSVEAELAFRDEFRSSLGKSIVGSNNSPVMTELWGALRLHHELRPQAAGRLVPPPAGTKRTTATPCPRSSPNRQKNRLLIGVDKPPNVGRTELCGVDGAVAGACSDEKAHETARVVHGYITQSTRVAMLLVGVDEVVEATYAMAS